MPRIRTVKPQFFLHEGLFDLEQESGFPVRLAFAGLWVCSDRDGRFRWRPRELKAQILPHDNLDFSAVLDVLVKAGFVRKYRVESDDFGCIPSWYKHQIINNRESPSEIPSPPQGFMFQYVDASSTRDVTVDNACSTESDSCKGERKGKEGKGRERIICTLPLNDKTNHEISETEIEQWNLLFPGIDVTNELRHMKAWSLANPSRRKTKKGIARFITSWLSRAQDSGKTWRNGTANAGQSANGSGGPDAYRERMEHIKTKQAIIEAEKHDKEKA